jgi:hypothetical protein
VKFAVPVPMRTGMDAEHAAGRPAGAAQSGRACARLADRT